MAEGVTEGREHARQAAFCLRGLGCCVVLILISPVAVAFLVAIWLGEDPSFAQVLVHAYIFAGTQGLLVWALRRAVRSAESRRQLRQAFWWLMSALALLPVWLWASPMLPSWLSMGRRAARSYGMVATLWTWGATLLGLYMFYFHTSKAVRELGRQIRSPGLSGSADQTLATQVWAPLLWACALAGIFGAGRLFEGAGLGVLLPIVWLLAMVLFISLGAALVGLPLYWVVSYLLLMRQAAREAARAPTRPPNRPPHGPRIFGTTELPGQTNDSAPI